MWNHFYHFFPVSIHPCNAFIACYDSMLDEIWPSQSPPKCIYVTKSVFWQNKTTSAPKSVLCYDIDEDLTLVWNSVFTQSCSQNKETDSQRRTLSPSLHFIIFKKPYFIPPHFYHTPQHPSNKLSWPGHTPNPLHIQIFSYPWTLR